MSRSALLFVAMLLWPSIALAEAGAFQPPKPGPEHQKLAGLVGTWTSEGVCEANPFGPAEKWSSRIKNEWFPGKFAVVRHIEQKGSVTGDSVGLEIVAYDASARAHTWYGIDSMGWSGFGKGSIKKDVLRTTFRYLVKEKPYQVRATVKGLGSDRLDFTLEYSEDGKAWKVACTAIDTRVKG